jgi:hypothetical protein
MKKTFARNLLLLTGLLLPTALLGAVYQVDWYSADGGGTAGSTGGGVYGLAGTIGQSDPGSCTGGTYSLTGGFWSGAVIQTPGAPLLEIHLVNGRVTLMWKITVQDYVLEACSDLGGSPAVWTEILPPFDNTATHYFHDLEPQHPHSVFRLKKP